MKKIMYLLVFASTLTLAACGGDSISVSGNGQLSNNGGSLTNVDLPDSTASTQPVGTNSEGACSTESREAGRC